ncbi:extensin-like [Cynara cardunculus var. scolymus]|uniref:extensin-like n=1 Tax=Cynara cardunculus var. scolymus TaxID=59895 RepID=UPI000D62B7E6|nr:extensin-like [Cynara cardunculus var. scolymus]
MATTTTSPPPSSPHEEVENDNLHQLISGSQPPAASVTTPPSPIEEVDHRQQFANSNSPYSPPQTSVSHQPENQVDRQQPPPEYVEDQREPPILPSPPLEENVTEGRQTSSPPSLSLHSQPPSPTSTGDEHPPENLNPNHESPVSKQSLSPSTPTTRPEDTVHIPNCSPNQEHKSPSPSSPPPRPEDPMESPNYGNNPSPNQDHPPPTQNSPPPGPQDPVESPNYRNNHNPNPSQDHESPSPSSPPRRSPSQSPSATTLQASPKADESPKDPYSSPPPTADSPSSPQDTLEPNTDLIPLPAPPVGVPFLLHTVASSSPSKPQASPWTHPETANLIQAYQEKWYSVKKGPLKASQWEEVAITVAVRCGYDEPTKTAKQCRHKIEKLRKRYRSERGKPRSKATVWNFFKLMDNLQKGPLPISSSQPMELVEYKNPSSSNGKKRKNDDNDDGGSERVMRGLRTPVVHKHKGFYQEDNGEEEEEEEEVEEGSDDGEDEEGVAVQLAAEIKGFAERFVKMENKKIEMMRDTERYRMEMENKRMEMILESRKMLLEIVNKAFNSSSHKTQKKLSAS